jgi:HK97 family phage major capsid protein
MDAKELTTKRGEVQTKIDGMLSKDSLTAEERTEVKELEGQFETLSEQITAATEHAELLASNKKRKELLSKGNGRKTPADSTAIGDDDDGSTTRIDVVPKQPFRSLGEQLQAIAGAANSGGAVVDGRLRWDSLTAATGGAVAGIASDGGYLIQKDFSTTIMTRMNEIGNIKSRVNTIPISANSDGLELYAVDETSRATGSRWGGVQVHWGAEADEATAKKPKVRRMLLELKDLIGLAYASNRLLRDASALGAIFTQAFSEEMNFMIEDGLINGNGVGKPIGVLNSGAVVSVAKETGQAAATIVYENIVKMYSRCWLRSRPNAVWIYNQDIEPQLMTMSIGVGTAGQPVYLPAGGASASPYATLMGRPAFPVEYCATLGTTGDIMLIDFSQMAAIEKDAMQADQSIHVRFNTNENTFRFIYRFDAQPTWNSALTPYKGSATKSFAIKLDTRA